MIDTAPHAQTTAQTPEIAPVALIRQPHGGALRRGGTNRGGPGRPPSAVREMLRGDLDENAPILNEIARGKPVQRLRVALGPIASHLSCPNCGELGLVARDAKAAVQEIEVLASASPKERIAAIEAQAKYGLGAIKEISVENVRERVTQTLAVIRQHVAPELADLIADELRPIWT